MGLEGLRSPEAKNQGYHQLIEMKFGMGRYGYKKELMLQNFSLVGFMVLEI